MGRCGAVDDLPCIITALTIHPPTMHPMHPSTIMYPPTMHAPTYNVPHAPSDPPFMRPPTMRPPTLKRAACTEVEQLTYGELMPREIETFIVTVTLAMVASARGWRESSDSG